LIIKLKINLKSFRNESLKNLSINFDTFCRFPLRIIVAILLLFFLFNSGGYFLLFKWKQEIVRCEIRQEIKRQLKQGVPEEETVLIVIHPGEKIDWVKPEKEFWYKGGLFDIITSSTSNDTIFLRCINDTQEKVLFENLDNLVQHQQQSKEPTKLNYFKITGILETASFCLWPANQFAAKFADLLNFYPKISPEIPSPPPELV
jgi:hypothetical protein